jgi:hypothetical protein
MNQRDDVVMGIPGAQPSDPLAETDRLLAGVQDDLHLLDDLPADDQVPLFERMHTSLAEALARTADTAPPAQPGRAGA